jgi:UDP-glucose 4-epimerase
MSVVVLGHTGFLGRSIQSYLLQNGLSVLAASSKECNLLQADQLARYFARVAGPVQVVFCAGITRWVEDSFESMLQNIQMVRNLVTAAPRDRLAGVVYLSSTDVYGYAPELPITEQTLTTPANFYGAGKLCGEFLLRLPNSLDCPVTVLRLPGVYGPGDGARSIVGRLLEGMRRDGRVRIYGDGSARRDYIEISDVCEVIRRLLEAPFDGVLNAATGVSVTVLELIGLLAEATRLSPMIEYAPPDQAARDLVFDVALLRSVLPGLSLKRLPEGIASYVASTTTLKENMSQYG